jgi:branched-chain amino acid transport system substrate-binding protein
VIGANVDGPEWSQYKNMFSVIGNVRSDEVTTTIDKFLKSQGATTVGSIGYSISPNSGESAQEPGAAAPTVGLKVGYLDSQFPIGSQDLQPVALAMQQHHVDGVRGSVLPSTDIALYTAMKNLGITPKAFLGDDGYGSSLLNSGPAAVQGAQGMFFDNSFEPVELNTPSTQRFQAALAAVGVKSEPSVLNYWGYVSGLLLKQVLDQGAKPTSPGILAGLSKAHHFTADGLAGPGKNDDTTLRNGQVDGFDNCLFFVKVVGNGFQPVPNASPLCGTLIKNVYVTSTGVVR